MESVDGPLAKEISLRQTSQSVQNVYQPQSDTFEIKKKPIEFMQHLELVHQTYSLRLKATLTHVKNLQTSTKIVLKAIQDIMHSRDWLWYLQQWFIQYTAFFEEWKFLKDGSIIRTHHKPDLSSVYTIKLDNYRSDRQSQYMKTIYCKDGLDFLLERPVSIHRKIQKSEKIRGRLEMISTSMTRKDIKNITIDKLSSKIDECLIQVSDAISHYKKYDLYITQSTCVCQNFQIIEEKAYMKLKNIKTRSLFILESNCVDTYSVEKLFEACIGDYKNLKISENIKNKEKEEPEDESDYESEEEFEQEIEKQQEYIEEEESVPHKRRRIDCSPTNSTVENHEEVETLLNEKSTNSFYADFGNNSNDDHGMEIDFAESQKDETISRTYQSIDKKRLTRRSSKIEADTLSENNEKIQNLSNSQLIVSCGSITEKKDSTEIQFDQCIEQSMNEYSQSVSSHHFNANMTATVALKVFTEKVSYFIGEGLRLDSDLHSLVLEFTYHMVTHTDLNVADFDWLKFFQDVTYNMKNKQNKIIDEKIIQENLGEKAYLARCEELKNDENEKDNYEYLILTREKFIKTFNNELARKNKNLVNKKIMTAVCSVGSDVVRDLRNIKTNQGELKIIKDLVSRSGVFEGI